MNTAAQMSIDELRTFLGQAEPPICPGCYQTLAFWHSDTYCRRKTDPCRECGRLLCRACLPDPLGACKDCELTRPAPDSFVGKSTRGEHDG